MPRSDMWRRCPVCRKYAKTKDGTTVKPHLDRTDRTICPMSGRDYELTLISNQ